MPGPFEGRSPEGVERNEEHRPDPGSVHSARPRTRNPHRRWPLMCPEPDLNRHALEGQRGLSSPCLHSTIRARHATPRWHLSLSGHTTRTAEQQPDVVLFY